MMKHKKTHSLRLFFLSFLMLFSELALIRWIGSQVYTLFFFSNLILLASFLGIGLGFLRAKSPRRLFLLSPFLLALLIAGAYFCGFQYHVKLNPITDNLDYRGMFFKNHLYPVWLTLPIIFILVASFMATLANEVARQFQKFPPLQAYRLEVLGSLAGILSFAFLSFSHAAPGSWGLVIALLFLFFLPKKPGFLLAIQVGLLLISVGLMAKETFASHHFWTSYYKVDVEEYSKQRYAVNVNGLTQQVIESVEQRKQVKPFYFLPYEHRKNSGRLGRVLIIGAGTGGDVAIALSKGAEQVDAVEIDTRLYELGKKMNPNQPYSDPRVHVYINDGRAFLQKSQEHYDLIIFALTDSLALIHGLASVRLENYLYTLEGLSIAQEHLTPNGVFAIYNYYGEYWFADRLAGTLNRIYKKPPCEDTFSPQDYWATVLTIGNPAASVQCKTLWQAPIGASISPSTDDHPFIYLQHNSIPFLYFFALAFISILSFYSIKWSMGSLKVIRSNLDFFFLGAAFLLLETKSIVNFALLFGTTWFVNCLVFAGILTTVYVSIELAHYFRFKRLVFLYVGLLLALFLAWNIPTTSLLSLSPAMRFVCASVLTFSPVLLANLIFSARFRDHVQSTEAFGANLIGAVLGGLLEYLALIIGYQNLMGIIAGLYVLAFIFMTRIRKGRITLP